MHSPFSLSLQIRYFISNFLTLRSHLWSSNSLNFFQVYSVYWLCLSLGNLHSHCWQVSGWRNTQCKQHQLQLNCFSTKKCANTFVLVYTVCQSPVSFPEELKDWTHQTQPMFQFATRVVWRTVVDFPQEILSKALSWELQPDVQTLDTDTPRFSSSTWKAGFMQIFLNNIEL